MVLYKSAMVWLFEPRGKFTAAADAHGMRNVNTDREQMGLAINIVNKHYSNSCLVYIRYL